MEALFSRFDLVLGIPEIALAAFAVAIVMVGVFQRRASFGQMAGLLAFGFLIAGAASLLHGFAAPDRWTAFNGFFAHDREIAIVKALIYLASAATLAMSMRFLQAVERAQFEYVALIGFATLGMSVLASANSLLTVYLGVELLSLPSYVLAAFHRDSARGSEAGLKYFVLGAIASGLLLYGMSLIYGFSGALGFAEIAARASSGDVGITFGLVLMICGLAFKVSAAPFHMWTPDVYEGAPTPVTAFFAAAPKFAGMFIFARLMFEAFPSMIEGWRPIIAILAIASMAVGAFGALLQSNVKRLMAYSSIGNIGYGLIAIAAGPEAMGALIAYLAIYVTTTIGIFGGLLALRHQGAYLERIEDLSGLIGQRAGMAYGLGFLLFSVAGIPPFAGFWGKLLVFQAGVRADLVWLAVAGILLSVVAAFYYLRLIKVMVMDKAQARFDTPLGIPSWTLAIAALMVSVGYIPLLAPFLRLVGG
ncbi:MAG TPA: NADH-quinone oxidoreductase subunit NuoN [Hyphomonadaceae bacterium]|nr:NADH-quinone oxidoreductase subunit NuoN [Hyphomonadaceae bacterium]